MKTLSEAGLKKGRIYEGIVASGSGKEKNAAPMGVKTLYWNSIILDVYNTSRTLANIVSQGDFTVNFTDDAHLFYDAVYDKGKIAYRGAKKTKAPIIKNAKLVVEAKAKSVRNLGERTRVTAKVLDVYGVKGFWPLNRAEYLSLELLVKATKLPAVPEKERIILLEEIRRTAAAVARTAPGSREEKLARRILSSLSRKSAKDKS